MPVSVSHRSGRFRIIESDKTIATTVKGFSRDNGGFSDYSGALRQMRAINRDLKALGKDRETLYINRPLLNGDEIIAWASREGFTKLIPPADLHVTIAFSKKPVSWADVPSDRQQVIVLGGYREVEKFEKGAVVLRFKSKALHDRWKEVQSHGASWDWPGFKPHITLTYEPPDGLDIDTIRPYTGTLAFGPERWAKVKEDWHDDIKEQKIA